MLFYSCYRILVYGSKKIIYAYMEVRENHFQETFLYFKEK